MADEKKLTVKLVRSAVASVKKDQTLTCRAMGRRVRHDPQPARGGRRCASVE